MSNNVQAIVTHSFSASPEAVFDAWVTGKHVRNWFGPGLGEIVRVAIDAREGGAFSFVQRRGLDDLDHHGKYLEFIRPERLVFTWAVKGTSDTSQVTVDIAATADGCQVSLTHDLHPHWKDYRERVAASWQKMLSAMATSIQSTP